MPILDHNTVALQSLIDEFMQDDNLPFREPDFFIIGETYGIMRFYIEIDVIGQDEPVKPKAYYAPFRTHKNGKRIEVGMDWIDNFDDAVVYAVAYAHGSTGFVPAALRLITKQD